MPARICLRLLNIASGTSKRFFHHQSLNDVILSDAKNLAFSLDNKILHGACPERNDKILRCAQNDKAKGSG